MQLPPIPLSARPRQPRLAPSLSEEGPEAENEDLFVGIEHSDAQLVAQRKLREAFGKAPWISTASTEAPSEGLEVPDELTFGKIPWISTTSSAAPPECAQDSDESTQLAELLQPRSDFQQGSVNSEASAAVTQAESEVSLDSAPMEAEDRHNQFGFHGCYLMLQPLRHRARRTDYAVQVRGGDGSSQTASVTVIQVRSKDNVSEEALFLRRIAGHEHCVRLLETHFEEPYAYLVTERSDLLLPAALAGRSAISELTLAFFFRQACQALASIHGAGIVHRNVKPASFIVTGDIETLKLTDFELAREEPTGGLLLEAEVGVPPFMSPEMVGGKGYSKGTDVWSLGASLYVLMLGRFPYFAPSVEGMKTAIREGVMEPDFQFCNGVAAVAGAGGRISKDAEDFLRRLLMRRQRRRATPGVALEHAWLQQVACTTHSYVVAEVLVHPPRINLKMSLESADWLGACSSGKPGARNEEVEKAMMELQRPFGGAHTSTKSTPAA